MPQRVAFLMSVACLLLVRPLGAADARYCVAVGQLPDIAAAERRALERACRNQPVDPEALQRALKSALVADDTSVSTILGTGVWPTAQDGDSPSSNALADCVKRHPSCNSASTTCYFAPDRPLCAGLAELEKSSGAVVAVAFSLQVGDAVDLLTQGPDGKGEYRVLTTLSGAAPFVSVALPKGAHYVYRFRRGDRTLALDRRIADVHVLHWLQRPLTRCLDVRVALPETARIPARALLLDGVVQSLDDTQKFAAKLQGVPVGARTLSIVDGVTVTHESVEVRPWKRGNEPLCQAVHLDHTRLPNIALVDVTVSAVCHESEVDARRLRAAAEWYLRDRLGEHAFRNSERITSLIRSLRDKRDVAKGSPAGAAKGQFDTSRILDTAEGELRRQGFTDALFLDLTCSGVESARSFTFEATRFDLDNYAAQRRDHLRGPPAPPITPATETVNDEDGLREGMAAVLDRSLGLPYARLSTGPSRHEALAPVELFYDTYGVDNEISQAVKLDKDKASIKDVKRLKSGQASRTCGELQNKRRLHGHDSPSATSPRYDKAASDARAKTETTKTVAYPYTAGEPGTYLVTLQHWRDGQWVVDERCLEIVRPTFVVTGDGAFGFAVPAWGADQYSRFRVGVRFQGANRDVDIGAFLGGSVTTYALSEPRSWDGVRGAPQIRADGLSLLEWEKKSLLAGVEWHVHPLRAQFGRISVQGFLSPALALNVGYIDASQLSGGVGTFDVADGDDKGVMDVDVDAFVRIGLRVLIGPSLEFELAAHGGLLGFDDGIVALARGARVAGGIDDDPGFIGGPQLGAGWGF